MVINIELKENKMYLNQRVYLKNLLSKINSEDFKTVMSPLEVKLMENEITADNGSAI